jgi:hypothetical protein
VARRIFLLSPANLGGPRALMLRDRNARSPLARALRTPVGAPLGEVMTFTSALYFRGKMAYARTFAAPPPGAPGLLVITPSAGLCSPDAHCTVETLDELAGVDIAASDERYRGPLRVSAVALAEVAGDSELVLLGSIATGKYTEVLVEIFGPRLLFPSEFVGRGDMSRGGLMLRCAADGRELAYEPVVGATRRGQRPPKLPARRR